MKQVNGTAVRWFSRAVDGMPDFGQGVGWTLSRWARAPRAWVSLGKLVATNRRGYLSEARAARYAEKGAGGDVYVVEHEGRYYVADGHHRAVAAMMRGEKAIAARVMRAGER